MEFNYPAGLFVDEIVFTQDFSTGSGGQNSLTFTPVQQSEKEKVKPIWISSTDTNDDTQHDYSIYKEDWEIIKRVIDNYFK